MIEAGSKSLSEQACALACSLLGSYSTSVQFGFSQEPRGLWSAGAHRRLGRNPRLSSRLNLSPRGFHKIISRAMRGNDRQAFEGVRSVPSICPSSGSNSVAEAKLENNSMAFGRNQNIEPATKGSLKRRCQTLASGQRSDAGSEG